MAVTVCCPCGASARDLFADGVRARAITRPLEQLDLARLEGAIGICAACGRALQICAGGLEICSAADLASLSPRLADALRRGSAMVRAAGASAAR